MCIKWQIMCGISMYIRGESGKKSHGKKGWYKKNGRKKIGIKD